MIKYISITGKEINKILSDVFASRSLFESLEKEKWLDFPSNIIYENGFNMLQTKSFGFFPSFHR